MAAKAPRRVRPSLDRQLDAITFGVRAKTPAPPALHRILVCLDGSDSSWQALEWAARLANGLKAKVAIVAVAPPGPPAGGLSEWAAVVELTRGSAESSQAVLREAKAWLGRRRVKATVYSEAGNPVARILAAAKDFGADLVAVGSRGTGSDSPMHLGSVADGLRHRVDCSLLIVREAPAKGPILAATDGSAPSRAAVALAARLAGALSSRLVVVHAVDVPAFGRTDPIVPDRKAVAAALEAAKAPKGPEFRIVSGPAARGIVEAVRDEGARLAVVGSRGLGGVKSLVLGSVSSRVSSQAPCSVLVVKD